MTPTDSAHTYLVALAEYLAAVYRQHTHPAAILLTGSTAEGGSDFYSDLDLIMYYAQLPDDSALEAARAQVPATDFRWLGTRTADQVAEDYLVNGVECQVAHTTIAAWEADMAGVLTAQQVDTPLQKALGGLLHGRPLHGADHIRAWQATLAAYPDALAQAMVQHYLQFWPLWYLEERLAARDAQLWVRETLIDAAYNILGVLAGLNRVYYTRFQFKRLRAFVAHLAIAPLDLAARLQGMLVAPPPVAVAELEALVRETTELVRLHLPAALPAPTRRPPGTRQTPWQPAPLPPPFPDQSEPN